MDHKSRVFASVFAVPSLSHTTPTPIATPDLGYTGPGKSFGSPFASAAGGPHRAVRRNLAWSAATRFLSLPKPPLGNDTSVDFERIPKSAEVEEALQYLLVGEGKSEQEHEEGLVEWYTNEARLHFATYVRPALEELWDREIDLRHAWEVLDETQRILHLVQHLYLQPFEDHVLPHLYNQGSSSTIRPGNSEDMVTQAPGWKMKRDIQAVFAHCLPPQRFSKTLSYVLYDSGCKLFRIYVRQDGLQASATPEDSQAFRKRLVALLQGLELVGLGGDNAQKAFAHAMDKLMDSFIVSHYLKVDWFSKKSMVPHLRMWIKDGFCPLVELVLDCLKCDPDHVQPTELQQWQDMALGRLGRARVDNLFDFVINWDKSLGAILDIKEYLKVSNAKQHLTSSFSQQVSRRLLHPGATTTFILNVYIYVIRAFHELEPKGVLLERVARPIRRYLKERDDTARIIISSLLTDLDDESGTKFAPGSELSYEIASEMHKPIANVSQDQDEELNWNDMNWQPLPSDASPDYKKAKVEDVIWFLLTLWDREDFIDELKNILGNHLLRCQDPEYEKEIRLLELIKIRLGDDKLQACEVMLRDVLDSKRINSSIQGSGISGLLQTPQGAPRTPQPSGRQLGLGPSTPSWPPPQPKGPKLNAQILSSFFWPPLREDDFQVPEQIQTIQKSYEANFERIKGMRKLRWMNALGDSSITLAFQDRTEDFEKLTPWQVSVICAFEPQPGEEWAAGGNGKGKATSSITRDVEQLSTALSMDTPLVRQALGFWVGKSVLRSTSPDTYEVIESLATTSNKADADAAAAAQEIAQVQAEAQSAAVKTQEDVFQEKKDVYRSFIVGMLTNTGNLPVMRIMMMMRMMVQGGFPFGMEELKGLLAEMMAEGKVVGLGGEVYGIRKA
ncbi:hypothetical protein BCR34DRAFT_483368 [Clohesyomyces aquaticus]|uniref:Anaphase-promoting complex subunit 2 n=1 Tax=Clohesyomyces aquaticus TaxID=1231657 RepID=A0A1Y1ZP36_9PLEO|nr:hypothetical protein BCR34DRAFT_483368 [Clohesyomyces aquaticus]